MNTVRKGICHGGPMDGQLLQHDHSRYDQPPKGFYIWRETPGARLNDGWHWVDGKVKDDVERKS